MRKYVFASFFAVVFLCTKLYAQEIVDKDFIMQQKEFSELVKEQKREVFTSHNKNYIRYDDLYIEKNNRKLKPLKDQNVKELPLYDFVITNDKKTNQISDRQEVVFNQSNNKFEVLTGVAQVIIEKKKSINLPNNNYKIKSSYPKMGLYFIYYPKNQNLDSVVKELKESNLVKGLKETVIIETISLDELNQAF